MANEFKVKNGLIVDQGGAVITGSVNISGSSFTYNGNPVSTTGTGSGVPGGSTNQIQYNLNGSIFGGVPTITYDGTNTIISGSSITGSFTGSLSGTSTSASYATTASYVANASSFPYTGSAIISGSLTVTGSTTINTFETPNVFQVLSGSTSVLTVSTSSIGIGQGATTFDPTNPETLKVSGSGLNLIYGYTNYNNYTQINVQNFNTQSNFSADLVATNNTGNETGNFVDLGINGSNFSGIIGGANDAYLYSTGSNFLIGNATSGSYSLKFFSGNNATVFPLIVSGSNAIMTGSFLGTASYATQALSASYAPGAAATPGGSNKNIQYNSASVFQGTANYNIEIDGRPSHLSTTASLSIAAPTSGSTKIFSGNEAGIDQILVASGLGLVVPLQRQVSSMRNFGGIIAQDAQSAFNYIGTCSTSGITTVGTQAAQGPSQGSLVTSSLLPTYNAQRFTSTTTTGSSASWIYGNRMLSTSTAAYGGGFYTIFKFGLPTYASTQRIMIGFWDAATAPTNVDPSSNTGRSFIAIAKNVADTNFQFMSGNGSTVTKNDTGIVPNQTDVYTFVVYTPSNSTSYYVWFIDQSITTSTVYRNANYSTTVPTAAGLTMMPFMWVNNGTVAAARALSFISFYHEGNQ